MTSLHRVCVNLFDGHKRKLMKAYRDREELNLRLANKI